jgi:hypothetical protein
MAVLRARITPAKAILSPWLDVLTVGGLSIVGVVALLVLIPHYPTLALKNYDLTHAVILAALINWPHFAASYRLLYSSRTMIRRYRGASIYVPLLLLGWCLVVLFTGDGSEGFAWPRANKGAYDLFLIVAILYLAWHWTGQAWGMTSVFAYLDDIRFTVLERQLLLVSFRSLLVWHVVFKTLEYNWFEGWEELVGMLFQIVNGVALGSLVVGLVGFTLVVRRIGRWPDVRVLIPWVAIYSWYWLVYQYPGAFLWPQLFHALQYLPFPARIEMNRLAARDTTGRALATRMAFYGVTMLVGGWMLFKLPDTLFGGWPLGALSAGLLGIFVNIHHYYIDSAIWKISNREVRADLFGHLPPPAVRSEPAKAPAVA